MAYDQMTADLLRENEALRAEIERLRMQLVACDVVAMANTRETAGEAREMHPDYWSASAQSVALAVDREMSHREEVERQAQEIAALRGLCAARDEARAEVEKLRGFLRDCSYVYTSGAAWRLPYLCDAIDNDGQPYQSQALADYIDANFE